MPELEHREMKTLWGLCVMAGLAVAAGAETAEFVIANGNDDAFTELVGNTDDITGTSIQLGSITTSDRATAGFRFITSGIGRGQVIQSATLRLYVESQGSGSGTAYYLHADTTPDSPSFESPNPSPGDRGDSSKTTANQYRYEWGTGIRDVSFSTAVVQEVINEATWDEGDPLTLLAIGAPSTTQWYSIATAYEGNPANAAKLILTFDPDQFQVPAGALGAFPLGDSGAVINFTDAPDTPGTITVQRIDSWPGGTFDGASALSHDSTAIFPDTVSHDAYWVITVTGLSGYVYSVIIDTTDIDGIDDADKLVIVKRDNSGDDWTPLNTTRSGSLLTAAGLTSFSEFSVGSEYASNTLPVELDLFGVE
ncbi:MAG: hypothetical protein PWP23_333 [Candidatus Sumerlaeota bacterium]|nr:hypothetical protein [Candidatus Sumerlaeota bacterium]